MNKTVVANYDCTGCSACSNICPRSAIKMELIDGFYKPRIDTDKCVLCSKCVSVCPKNYETKPSAYTLKAFACKNKDGVLRIKSTSGGIFVILANTVLDDQGVVYGASFDENFMVKHIRVINKEELSLLNHTKYVQSFVGEIYTKVKQDLLSGRTVLFSGTPCQCAGLNAFLDKQYDNLIIMAVLCHGVPSPMIWRNYLEYRLRKANSTRIIEAEFRNKDVTPTASWHRSYIYMKFDRGDCPKT